jgi:hypothetical protein
MVRYVKNSHGLAFSLTLLLFATAPAWGQSTEGSQCQQNCPGQNSKPLSVNPAAPGTGKNHRLILKDGTYQLAREYQVVGDRVRFLSQERGEWEELPADLVDWDATRKWEMEHTELTGDDASPAMKEAEAIDKEEAEERDDQKARMPEVSPGLELPDENSAFVLDTYHGTPELIELTPSDLSMYGKSRHGIGVLNPLATEKAHLELEGAHARVHIHVNDPALYLSLGLENTKEPVLTHAMTVQTNGANAVNGDHGAHSPQSGFVVVRVDERQAVRIVGAVRVSANGTVSQDEDTIPTKVEVVPGKHWLRLQPQQPLKIGEYALVEILSPSDISEWVWDFRVDPTLGDNRNAIGPILPQGREAEPATADRPGSAGPVMSEHPDKR